VSATFNAAEEDAERPTRAVDSATTLAPTLRSAAMRASRHAGGALVLIFMTPTEGETGPQLRSAAGFTSPADARAAGAAVLPNVEQAMRSGQPQLLAAPQALGAMGAAHLSLYPLAYGDATHGVLTVASSAPIPEAGIEELRAIAESIALRLDFAAIASEVETLRGAMEDREKLAENKSQEILKLSEALFAQDIELLRHDEKLGKIEKLKNDFIEKMSCELRTPLNSIIESIISVLASENDALSDASKKSLRGALDEGTAFLRTLQNILDLWRIKEGELPVEIQDVNLREVVDEAIFSVQDALGDKELEIENHLDESFPTLRTDLAKINQILFLILDNAVKFTPNGRIDIRAGVENDRLQCTIQDTGIGICADDRQFMFDEFYQVDELSSTKYRGAGLGLALVRDLLSLLEGEIEIDSDVGKGSTFTVKLPVEISG
jgi:signal transduction histidine kinase